MKKHVALNDANCRVRSYFYQHLLPICNRTNRKMVVISYADRGDIATAPPIIPSIELSPNPPMQNSATIEAINTRNLHICTFYGSFYILYVPARTVAPAVREIPAMIIMYDGAYPPMNICHHSPPIMPNIYRDHDSIVREHCSFCHIIRMPAMTAKVTGNDLSIVLHLFSCLLGYISQKKKDIGWKNAVQCTRFLVDI